MKKITVFHPQNSHINQGHTDFCGELLGYSRLEDGSLLIKDWRTNDEQGTAVFARGQWAYVCESKPYKAA